MDLETSNNEPKVTTPVYKKPIFQIVFLVLAVLISYRVGWQAGNKGYIFVAKSFEVVNQKDQPVTVDYDLLWKAIDLVNKKYIDKPVDAQKVLEGAIKGAVEASGDQYTTYLNAKALQNFKTQLAGNFSGIGAEVGMKNDNVVIIAPLAGSPAEKAGVKAGDYIVAVDGQNAAGWSVEDAVEKIRGPKGTSVTITVARKDAGKTIDIKIVRDTIVVKSVVTSYKTTPVNGQDVKIAVIKVSEFGDDTTGLFSQAVNEVLQSGAKGLVVDLRNNPGGYLSSAVDLASNWVAPGDLIVSEAHSDGSKIDYKGLGNPRLSGMKTVILINGGTASAAEILSGALHDHKFAALIGEKSFGKGSVQEIDNLKGGNDSSAGAVKITIAKWITPNGVNLNHNGLDPDVVVKVDEQNTKDGNDPQMNKALEEVVK